MTSKNICKTHEFDKSVFYKAHCSCSSENHTQTLVLDVEDEQLYLRIYHKVFCAAFWCPINFNQILKDFYIRLKLAYQILTKGYVEYEGEFIFEDETSIQDYINALQEGLNKIKSNK